MLHHYPHHIPPVRVSYFWKLIDGSYVRGPLSQQIRALLARSPDGGNYPLFSID
jgi:hypothetical protein